MSLRELRADLDGDARAAQALADRIKPLMAGRSPEIQSAVLAELLATFIAGHYTGGAQAMTSILDLHDDMVRKLIPLNVEILKKRRQ
jgi:hypothetical protein